MQSATSSSWGRAAIARSPLSGHPIREIADFVRDSLLAIHEREPTRRELREFCESEGYSWNHIIGELRRIKLSEDFDALYLDSNDAAGDTTDFKTSPSGIAVNVLRTTELLGDLQPPCPFIMSFADTWTFTTTKVASKCNSWCCPDCGLTHADTLLRCVRLRIADLPEVFVGDASWDPGLAARMRGRRKDRHMQMFWYRRIDGRVFYVADKPFGGREEPTTCRPVPPAEALTWLAREVMWVPGHHDHDFSKGWNFPLVKVGGGDLLSLAGLNDPEIQVLMGTFVTQAFQKFGVRVDCGSVPREHRNEALLKGLKARALAGRGPDDSEPHG